MSQRDLVSWRPRVLTSTVNETDGTRRYAPFLFPFLLFLLLFRYRFCLSSLPFRLINSQQLGCSLSAPPPFCLFVSRLLRLGAARYPRKRFQLCPLRPRLDAALPHVENETTSQTENRSRRWRRAAAHTDVTSPLITHTPTHSLTHSLLVSALFLSLHLPPSLFLQRGRLSRASKEHSFRFTRYFFFARLRECVYHSTR